MPGVEMWLAQMVKEPARPLGSSLVMLGGSGAGKTLLGEGMRVLMGDALAISLCDKRQLTGDFNGHTAEKLLIQLEEAVYAGDHAVASTLKHRITPGRSS